MKHARPLAGLLLMMAAFAAASAHARQQEAAGPSKEQAGRTPQAQEEQAGNAALQAQGKPGGQPFKGMLPGEVEPADSQRTRSGKPPPPRRNVPANIATMPQPSAPQAYGPVLHDMAPQTTMPAPAPPGLPNPAPLNSCFGGQCWDTSGNTYNTGVGNAAISSGGRLCNRIGNTVQCF